MSPRDQVVEVRSSTWVGTGTLPALRQHGAVVEERAVDACGSRSTYCSPTAERLET